MELRTIELGNVTKAVEDLAVSANYGLSCDIENALRAEREKETSEAGKMALEDLIENLDASKRSNVAICQDTGMAVVFMEIGQDVHFTGGSLEDAVNEGVRRGYQNGYLRFSVVRDPMRRGNTEDNTPAVLHTFIVPGDKVKITVAPKGFGSENMSAIKMMTPAATRDDVIAFVVDTVKKAGSNPCPPIVVGVGIGGTFEKCTLLSKKALLRPIDQNNPDSYYAKLEEDILEAVNKTGIGPQGFGGKTTALGVNVEAFPTHIAGLPVAVNINCHVARHKDKTL